jgi:transcriptional regulator with XRE-family HTH domain
MRNTSTDTNKVEGTNMSRAINDEERILAEEAFIVDAQFAIHNLLEAKGMSRADLARALNISEARVSQLFGHNPKNLTLRTIARIFRALGEEPRLTSDTLDRLIPAASSEPPALADSIPDDGTMELMDVMLREVMRSRLNFVPRANDNIIEDDLVAA